MAYKVLACLALLAVSSAKRDQSRWSRQINSYTSDISDWVPLTAPINTEPPIQLKRQIAEPRILSEPISGLVRPSDFDADTFSSRGFYNSPGGNRQLYLQSVPSAPQNYLTDQGFNQGFRFGLSQPNFPLTQGFVAPQFNFNNVPQLRPKPQVSNPIRFDNFPQQIQSVPPSSKPNFNQPPKPKVEVPKYIDGYRMENNSDIRHIATPQRKPQSLHKIRFDEYDKSREIFNVPKPKTEREREEVQLLYVPVESLNRGQFNFRSPLTSAQLLNTELYNPNQKPNPIRQNFGNEYQRPITKPFNPDTIHHDFMTNFSPQLNGQEAPNFSTLSSPFPTPVPTTTVKPKKLKPHQPPLAIFLTQNEKKENEIKVGDVLSSLKSAKSVAVLDTVNPLNAPEVFIGPSSLTPPERYVKFELPYLSNIENKDKKLKQLPFFVAPLSYNTPQGFAKIPFPSPHVGSVVINSQIQEASSSTKPSIADVYSYKDPSIYDQPHPVTQKPKMHYYSTVAPKENYVNNYEQNYYSFEPQTVSTLRPYTEQQANPGTTPPKTASYFLSNIENQFNPSQYSNFQPIPNYQNHGTSIKTLNTLKTTPTPKTTTTTTTKPPSTYPSQLLETHNPFSINQAFHFSTSNDQNVYDEFKEPYATQGLSSPPSSTSTLVSYPDKQTVKSEEANLHKSSESNQLSTSSYQQSYSPEIQYQTEIQRPTYSNFNTNDYSTKNERPQHNDYIQQGGPINDNVKSTEEQSQRINNAYSETQTPVFENYTNTVSGTPESQSYNIQSTNPQDEYSQYETNYSSEEIHPASTTTSTSTTTTTTTTRRTPIRTRGRPRYPTTKPTESSEYSTRSTVTRKPVRDRRPLPNRPRYEPNRVTTERSTRKPLESSETTTKSFKPRIRGKLHYKPTDGDESYEKPSKKGKEDLAYQRDILHQNYPVTLMERASTVDIEAITEPTVKADSSDGDSTKSDDTENAYSNDKLSITEHVNSQIKDVSQYTSAVETDTDIYVPKVHTNNDEYYQSKTSVSPQDNKSSYETKEDPSYTSYTTPEVRLYENEYLDSKTDHDREQGSLEKNEYSTEKITLHESENTKAASNELSHEQEHEVNVVETTPSYNRVRIRPGVIRQHHPISSTESTRNKNDRRNNAPITYRPAFDKRRTTMRIEEIEADLKTKQVHSRPEFKDYRQPVYKPDPVTESVSSTTEATTKRSQHRRKRPTYTTSTEGAVNRRPYEVKNRFRGRRPTEKPTEKPDTQTDVTTTSAVRNVSFSKYIHRPRLSERYNKKPEAEETVSEDQDSNYSLHRPKYATPESDRWSPKISVESFKPYNPNDIVEEDKAEKGDSRPQDEELDIITAKNDDNVLISVTPATNHRNNKNIDDVPPTLEALVEKTQAPNGETGEPASTFESMLEEVMKSLEEQDEDEYTSKVMKHKGGEIGEIPPEKIISSGVNYSLKSTRLQQEQTTTPTLQTEDASTSEVNEKEDTRKSRRRGYWKKVKVSPAEGIDVAESQYYSDTVNKLGDHVSKNTPEKSIIKTEVKVTTYKPKYQFIKDFFYSEEDAIDGMANIDLPKINVTSPEADREVTGHLTTEASLSKETPIDEANPGDMDLGTGSPDPTFDDSSYYSEPTEATFTSTKVDRSDKLSFMDYLFGVSSSDESDTIIKKNDTKHGNTETTERYKTADGETHQVKVKATTESAYIPEEITADTHTENTEYVTQADRDSAEERTEVVKVERVESSSVSSYMDPTNVVSTSMSTEVSHETEICFRGKCIKTNKDIL